MYKQFFGFQRAPFELVPDPDFLFLGETHDSALANLVLGIGSGKGFVAISGPVGAGKTTVLRALLRRLGPDRSVCFLNQPEHGVSDLLRTVLSGFGDSTKNLDVVDLRQRIRELLEGLPHPGILIVDEAHLLTEDTLEQIRLLSNLEHEKRKLLQIVLSGQPELMELLSSPRLRPLTQRIEMFYEIRPLEDHETKSYIERRLRIAGQPTGLWFEDGAVAEIHSRTGGIPRLINILAERCLITAYVGETRRIDRGIVHEAYRDLGAVTHSVMPGRDLAAPVPIRPRKTEARSAEARPRASTSRAREGDDEGSAFRSETHPRNARRPGSGERWIPMAGITAVAVLALVSLGSRQFGIGTNPALPAATDESSAASDTVRIWSDSDHGALESGDGDGPARDATGPYAEREAYAVHVASFRDLDRARQFASALREDTGEGVRISPTEIESGLWYRVLLGDYPGRDRAEERRIELRASHDLSFVRIVRLIHPEEVER